jgi:hypothetical protein
VLHEDVLPFCFMIGRNLATATRNVNAFFMLQLRCAKALRSRMQARALYPGNETG